MSVTNPDLNLKAAPTEITTLTLFGLKPGNTRWGLAQMGLMPRQLKAAAGLKFFKMLGSGRGLGFSIRPDFNRYGLLCVWHSEEQARRFFEESVLFQQYLAHTFEHYTIWLNPLQAHGSWDGTNPFPATSASENYNGPVAALTRATIRLRALPAFWKHVPQTSQALKEADGLIASIGLGELPFIRQATFSIWQNSEALKKYAYQNKFHRDVIRETRAGNWYKEELFARFIPIRATGTWNGKDPLGF